MAQESPLSDDELKTLAGKCPHEVSCIVTGKCGDHECCKVERAFGGHFMFLKDSEYQACPYQSPFGFGMICSCPVHYLMHTTYRKYRNNDRPNEADQDAISPLT